MKTEDFEAGLDLALDKGIRRYVIAMRDGGIETFESCQGGNGHAYPEPTIRFYGNAYEGFKAFTVAMNNGLPVFALRRIYMVEDSMLVGPYWEMVFKEADEVVSTSEIQSVRS